MHVSCGNPKNMCGHPTSTASWVARKTFVNFSNCSVAITIAITMIIAIIITIIIIMFGPAECM